jgi:uncharacterized protein (TIRG00374 family)
MIQGKMKYITGKRGLFVGWLTAVAILSLIIYWLGIENILESLKKVSIRILLLSVIPFIAGAMLRLIKWKIVVGSDYDWKETACIHFASKVAGGLLPARVGEFAPLASPRYRTAKVSALIIIDRIFETYATLFIGAISFIIIGFRNQTLIILWSGVFIILSIGFFVLLYKGLWQYLEIIAGKWRWLSQFFRLLEKVSHSLQTTRSHWLLLIFISLLATVLDFIYVQLIFLSLGEIVNLFLVAAAWCASVLTSAIAVTPSGLGIADMPPLYLYHLYGVESGNLGASLILSRGISFVLPILLLYFTIFFRRRNI